MLLISGQRDSYVTPEIATSLQQSIGGNSELWLVPGARHNRSREVDEAAYDARIVAFVEPLCCDDEAETITKVVDRSAIETQRSI